MGWQALYSPPQISAVHPVHEVVVESPQKHTPRNKRDNFIDMEVGQHTGIMWQRTVLTVIFQKAVAELKTFCKMLT